MSTAADNSADPLLDPRVRVDRYVIYPSCYDQMANDDRDHWCVTVSNGHRWGWRITEGKSADSMMAFNRRGDLIVESRGSGNNKPRRWTLDEALRIALEIVETHTIVGLTAADCITRFGVRTATETQA